MNDKERIEVLEEQIKQMNSLLSIDDMKIKFIKAEYKLSPTQGRILSMLIKRSYVSYDMIHSVLYGDRANPPSNNVLSVLMCGLRKRLKPANVEIKTLYKEGWFLDEKGKEELLRKRFSLLDKSKYVPNSF